IEFAFEIGSGLLTEVRRLQSMVCERDKAVQDMKEEKDDSERTVESLRTALRAQERSAEQRKEENWNLEVTLQELRTQLTDTRATSQRLEDEHKRLTKQLDQHKNDPNVSKANTTSSKPSTKPTSPTLGNMLRVCNETRLIYSRVSIR
ncbi:hypothetical protein JAAARDRAFT_128624, partial [Jaapia argillacea MUCL 33604]